RSASCRPNRGTTDRINLTKKLFVAELAAFVAGSDQTAYEIIARLLPTLFDDLDNDLADGDNSIREFLWPLFARPELGCHRDTVVHALERGLLLTCQIKRSIKQCAHDERIAKIGHGIECWSACGDRIQAFRNDFLHCRTNIGQAYR